MSKNDKITKEKERLMKEVLGKNRGATYDSVDAKTYLERKDNALKQANNIMDELNSLLLQQQKELGKMNEKITQENKGSFSDEAMEKLQKDIEKDFWCKNRFCWRSFSTK